MLADDTYHEVQKHSNFKLIGSDEFWHGWCQGERVKMLLSINCLFTGSKDVPH